MHKLVTGPSKAKTRALARLGLALACCAAWAAGTAWASDIVIRSGEGEDTVMQAGPGVGSDEGDGNMRIESDPDNGTLMLVTPPRRDTDAQQYQGPLIIAPEIHTRGRK